MKEYVIGEKEAIRAALAEGICEAADLDERVWAVTSDCGQDLIRFTEEHKDRFVDDGIAEQNAAGIAAGLAISGAIPFVIGMAPFVTMRAFEQNRSAISYQNLPVRIVGYVAGMTTGGGSTHYAMEDIAIMRSLPNMKVISVGCPALAAEVVKHSVAIDGPCYIRAGNGQQPVLYDMKQLRFEIGKGIVAREGSDVTIFTHGVMVAEAIALADRLKENGVSVQVIDLFTIKPLDRDLVLESSMKTKKVIVWEDHYTYGGLGSAIADLYVDAGYLPERFVRVGIPQTYPGFGANAALYRKYGMDADAVASLISEMA